MHNAKLCLYFVLAVFTVKLIECKGGHGGGHGSHSSHGGHSSHSSHGSHSSRGGWFSGWGTSSSSSSSHSYPHSTGYSGHGMGGSHGYPNSRGYSGHGYSGSGGYWSSNYYGLSRPTYYTAPQHVYVTRYREAQSPYSDLLTGLTMYNLGRSHHYDHHYYNDDFQRSSSSGVYSPVNHGSSGSEWQDNNGYGTNDEAKCVLKIKKDRKLEVLKIPCAIVSTFDNGKRTSIDDDSNTPRNNCSPVINMNMTLDINSTFTDGSSLNSTSHGDNTASNNTLLNSCVNQTVDITDPLSVTGAPIAPADANGMECFVEIITDQEVIRNNIDCITLLKYAEMAVPEDKVTNILPPREKLKTMLKTPPWWLSLFIAV